MKKKIKVIIIALIMSITFNPFIVLAEDDNQEHNHTESFSADHHHSHGSPFANFIPAQILNPDDSEYEAPEVTEEYVGLYVAQTSVPALNAELNLILNIREDGLINMAYYYDNEPEATGARFYADETGEIEKVDAIYQDLIVLTAALREGEGGLGSGLIGETISPIVLLDEEGQPQELYAYMTMAYGLRENYVNARVYQNIGLYIADEVIAVDVNHLIGLESDEQIVAQFEKLAENDERRLLVEVPTFEVLQNNFDTHLIDHNDFDITYQSANEFVQKVLAMHLETNASFPQDTEVVAIDGEKVILSEEAEAEVVYAMLINDSILYAYDGEHLYMTTEFDEDNGQYISEEWLRN